MAENSNVAVEIASSIKDSGHRRQFESGAVRDIHDGKGRCDLLPLDIVAGYLDDLVLMGLGIFVETGRECYLVTALREFTNKRGWDDNTMLLEVSRQFEDGCIKYGEDNWQKGIPAHCYIDSAVRHYLKWRRGDNDEPHDRAFCWNVLCCIWTCRHKSNLNDFPRHSEDDDIKEA